MTTQFDTILKAAYDAGYEAADNGRDPNFDDWRASLSGRDLNGQNLHPGDTVEIVGDGNINSMFHEYYGQRGIAQQAGIGDGYLFVWDPHTGQMLGGNVPWPKSALRKINA